MRIIPLLSWARLFRSYRHTPNSALLGNSETATQMGRHRIEEDGPAVVWRQLGKMALNDILCNPDRWTDSIKRTIDKSMDECITIANDLHEEKDVYKEELSEIREAMISMSELLEKADHLGRVMRTIQETADEGQRHQDIPDLEETFRTNMSQFSTSNMSEAALSNVKVKELNRMLQESAASSTEEEELRGDIMMCQLQVALKCPLTQVLMEEPVTNKPCGHSYSKKAILSHIRHYSRRHRHAKCPIGGCEQTVAEGNLEANKELEIAIKRKVREKRKPKKDNNDAAVNV